MFLLTDVSDKSQDRTIASIIRQDRSQPVSTANWHCYRQTVLTFMETMCSISMVVPASCGEGVCLVDAVSMINLSCCLLLD